jgi:Uma2 family endonuclease
VTAPPAYYSHNYPYTADEVLGWPEDGIRHEVIDGSLIVSPHANMRHQILLQRLNRALDRALPAGWEIVAPVNLRLGADKLVVPDLVVVSHVDLQALAAIPDDVRLIVEVVSPGNRRTDRMTKPGLYAEAGITHFWLFDDLTDEDGPSLHLFQLPTGASSYPLAAPQTGTVTITEPFPVTIDLLGLLR